MLLEFSGERTGSITMFGDVAVTLLKMMGQTGQTEGAIREGDIPAALESLTNALSDLPPNPQSNEDDDNESTVSLSTRANPLVQLLEESVSKGGYVMWKPH